MRGGKHELELYDTRVVPQLAMLDAVELIGDVCSANVYLRLLETEDISLTFESPAFYANEDDCCPYLKGSHPDDLITVVEEVGQNVKDGRF